MLTWTCSAAPTQYILQGPLSVLPSFTNKPADQQQNCTSKSQADLTLNTEFKRKQKAQETSSTVRVPTRLGMEPKMTPHHWTTKLVH